MEHSRTLLFCRKLHFPLLCRVEKGQLIFGTRAVIEALEAGRNVDKILVQKGLNNELYNELRRSLKGKTVPLQVVPSEKLRRLTDKNHQGVVAFITEITYHDCREEVQQIFERGEVPLVLILDRITDVRNFGAIARTAECAGVHLIVVPSRGAAQINADAIKTSAGALHRIKVCREDNLKTTLEDLKNLGLRIIACHEKTETLIYDADFTTPCAIIMGSEEDGISGEYLRRSNNQVKIPMAGKIASLNVSVAAGIVLFEALKQRIQR